MTSYSADFYESISDSSYSSAKVILPIVFEILRPKTVIDVGCGSGTWLAAAQDLGVSQILGFEGPWIASAVKMRASIDIRVHDLETPLPLIANRFDMAMCLEVAEHLTSSRAEGLVSELCALSDCVLFSAAIPTQSGTNHINCQWQSYWAGLFKKDGRHAVDLVRPEVWGREDVDWWYQQNCLLYLTPAKLAELKLIPLPMRKCNVVHPRLLDRQPLSFKQIVEEAPKAILRSLRQRMK